MHTDPLPHNGPHNGHHRACPCDLKPVPAYMHSPFGRRRQRACLYLGRELFRLLRPLRETRVAAAMWCELQQLQAGAEAASQPAPLSIAAAEGLLRARVTPEVCVRVRVRVRLTPAVCRVRVRVTPAVCMRACVPRIYTHAHAHAHAHANAHAYAHAHAHAHAPRLCVMSHEAHLLPAYTPRPPPCQGGALRYLPPSSATEGPRGAPLALVRSTPPARPQQWCRAGPNQVALCRRAARHLRGSGQRRWWYRCRGAAAAMAARCVADVPAAAAAATARVRGVCGGERGERGGGEWQGAPLLLDDQTLSFDDQPLGCLPAQ